MGGYVDEALESAKLVEQTKAGAAKEVPGVVAVMTGPDGYVWASVSDFNATGYSGFSLAEAQELRARNALRAEFIRQSCGQVVAEAVNDYIADQIVKRLKGFRETFIRIGHPAG